MKKMHGRWLTSSILFVTLCMLGSPSLELDIESLDGETLAIVGAGQPFIVRVTCDGMQGNCTEPAIHGLDQLEIENRRFAMHTLGKQSTIVHSYTVRADMPGSYIIGPAHLQDDTGQTIESNVITISVGADHTPKQKEGKNKKEASKKHASYFLRLVAKAEQVYIGERIACSLRLYHDKQMRPEPIEQRSDLKKIGLVLSDESGPTYGEKEIDGKRYGYYEWMFDIIPTKLGRIVLPAFSTLVPSPSSWPSSFFMTQSLQRIYSNAVAFKVVPIESDQPVDAVGHFTSLTAHVTPGAARQGSAMILTVEVEGDKNVASLDRFTIQGMPRGLRVYESAQRVVPASRESGYVKQFEFVLHGIEQGEWEIPEQSLTYFDSTDRQCRTIASTPLRVTVLPGVQNQEIPDANDNMHQNQSGHEDEIRENVQANQAGTVRAHVPWWLFLLFLLPVCFVFIKPGLQNMYRTHMASYVYAMFRWYAYAVARRNIRYVQRTGTCEHLYKIFVSLLAIRMEVSENMITKEMIIQAMSAKGLDQSLVQQWEYFFYELEQASFKDEVHSSCYQLCQQSLRWITILKKVL